MPTIEIDGVEQEFICTAYTTTIYEQEFITDPNPKVSGDIIADVMRTMKASSSDFIDVDEDGEFYVMLDYESDNWNAEKRALWAMLKTANEIRRAHREKVKRFPSYKEWDRSLLEWEPDMHKMSFLVCNELQRGLFRSGAAASENNQQEEGAEGLGAEAPVHLDD